MSQHNPRELAVKAAERDKTLREWVGIGIWTGIIAAIGFLLWPPVATYLKLKFL